MNKQNYQNNSFYMSESTTSRKSTYSYTLRTQRNGGELDIDYHFSPAEESDGITPPEGASVDIKSISCMGSDDLSDLLESFGFDFEKLQELIIADHLEEQYEYTEED